MRLIDADMLCADLRMQWEQVFSKMKVKVRPEDFFIKRLSAFQAACISSDIDAFIDYLSSRPTIAAVPVVRCKDCKHFRPCEEVDGETWLGWCAYGEFNTDDLDFCSRGERRTDEQ